VPQVQQVEPALLTVWVVRAQVQEAAAAAEGWLRLPEAALNLASVCLAQDQPGPAIQLYTSALRRRGPGRRLHCGRVAACSPVTAAAQ
jgi:hypothetical protein